MRIVYLIENKLAPVYLGNRAGLPLRGEAKAWKLPAEVTAYRIEDGEVSNTVDPIGEAGVIYLKQPNRMTFCTLFDFEQQFGEAAAMKLPTLHIEEVKAIFEIEE